MANNRKKTAKDTLSNPPPRVGTRKRTAKKLDDYVDASFSESEPPHLHNNQSITTEAKCIKTGQSNR
jgi:hypothetical protein